MVTIASSAAAAAVLMVTIIVSASSSVAAAATAGCKVAAGCKIAAAAAGSKVTAVSLAWRKLERPCVPQSPVDMFNVETEIPRKIR